MGNPTTHVETFNGSLGSFTGSGPILYNSGLVLAEAVTNIYPNPVGGNSTTGLQTLTNRTNAVVSVPAPLPGELAALVTDCYRVTPSTNQTGTVSVFLTNNITFVTAVPNACSVYVYVPSGFSATGLELTVINIMGATVVPVNVNMATRDAWQRVANCLVTPGAGLSGTLQLHLTSGTWNSGEPIYFVVVQAETSKGYSGPPAVGSWGTGFSFSGTAHQSNSVRAASSAAISPSGILAPGSGALAFRITPTIETGVEEIWGECGVKGSGTDHLRWGRDSTKHPFCEWSSNDAAYQRLTATETVDAGTAYDLYLGFTGIVTSLAVDAGTLQSGTRAAVSGDFSTGDLTLEASAGGVIYQPFATFDRPLMNHEVARLNSAGTWTMGTVLARRFDSVQLARFRLSSCMGVR